MVDHLVNSDANTKRIQRIENGFGASGIPLQKSGRVLLGEGVLTKICKKKPKQRQFFLFNDILVYGNIVIGSKKIRQYNKQHIIPLEEIKLENIEDDGGLRNGWFICSRKKSFAVFASTPIEKQQWIEHIERAVSEHLRYVKISGPRHYAATMIPDSEASECMHCKKSQFTFVNRRHHCRRCGMVVCGGCSNQKALLPDQSDKPQRVCLTCATELKREEELRKSLLAGDGRIDSIAHTPASPDDEDSDDDYRTDGISGDGGTTSFYNGRQKFEESHVI